MKARKCIIYIMFLLMIVTLFSQQYSMREYKNDMQTAVEIMTKTIDEQMQNLMKTTEELTNNIQSIAEQTAYLLLNVDPKPDILKMKVSTAQVKVGKAGGAGVIVKDDGDFLYILTAKHITDKKGKLAVAINNKDVKKKVVIQNINRKNVIEHEVVDLSLIKVLRPKGTYEVLKIAKKQPKVGDTIYTVGHPVGTYYTVNIGIVSNYLKNHYKKRKGIYMMISAPSIFGNSGGAVVNCQTEIVGICSGIIWIGKNKNKMEDILFLPHMTLTVRLKDIEYLLKKVE